MQTKENIISETMIFMIKYSVICGFLEWFNVLYLKFSKQVFQFLRNGQMKMIKEWMNKLFQLVWLFLTYQYNVLKHTNAKHCMAESAIP